MAFVQARLLRQAFRSLLVTSRVRVVVRNVESHAQRLERLRQRVALTENRIVLWRKTRIMQVWSRFAKQRISHRHRQGRALRRLDTTVARWQHLSLHRAFQTWLAFAVVAPVELRERHSQVSHGVWLLHRVVARWRRAALARSFRSLQASTRGHRRTRFVVQSAQWRWRHNRLRCGFGRWAATCRWQRDASSCLERVVRHLQHRELSQAWLRFHHNGVAHAHRAAHLARLRRRVVSRLRHRALGRAVSAWRAACVDAANQRHAVRSLQRLARAWAQGVVARAWRTWVGHTSEVRGGEARAEAMQRRAAGFWRHRRLARALRLWRGGLVRSQRARTGLLLLRRCAAGWQHRRMALAWRRWRGVAHLVVVQASAASTIFKRLVSFRQRRLASALSVWRAYTAASPLTVRVGCELLDKMVRTWRHRMLARAWRVWGLPRRSLARDYRHGLDVLHRVLQRATHASLARAWSKWRAELDAGRRTGAGMRLLHRTVCSWQRRVVARGFHAWARRTVHHGHGQRREDTLLRHAAARFRQRSLARAVRQWQAGTHAAARRRAGASLLGRVVAAWRQRVLARGFHTWARLGAASAAEDRLAAVLLRQAAARFRQRSLARGFAAWQAHTSSTARGRAGAVLLRRTVLSWQRRQLARGLHRWRAFAAGRGDIATGVALVERVAARWRRRDLARAMRQWAGAARRCSEEAVRGEKLLRRGAAAWTHRRQLAALRALRAFALRRRQGRTGVSLLDRVARRWRRRLLARGLGKWATLTRMAVDDDRFAGALMRQAAARFRHRALARAWKQWQPRQQPQPQPQPLPRPPPSRAQLAGLLLRRYGRVQQRCFYAWRAVCADASATRVRQRAALALLNRTARGYRGRSLSRAWASWRGAVFGSGRRRAGAQLLARMVRRWRARVLGRAFVHWRIVSRRSAQVGQYEAMLMRQAQARFRQRNLAKAMRSWQAMVFAGSRQRSALLRLQRIVAAVVHRRTSAAMNTWKQHTREVAMAEAHHMMLIRQVASRLQNRTVARAFASWRTLVARSERYRAGARLLERTVNNWNHQRMARAMNTWRSSVFGAAQMHSGVRVLRRLVARWQRAAMARGFATWRMAVHRASEDDRYAVMLMRQAHARFRQRSLAKAMRSWQAMVFAGSQQRAGVKLLDRVLHGWQHRQLAQAWTTWVLFLRDAASADADAAANALHMGRGADRVSALLLRWRHRATARAFAKWSHRTSARRETTNAFCATLRSVCGAATQRRLARAWATWRLNVQRDAFARSQRRHMLALLANMQDRGETRTLLDYFTLWRQVAQQQAARRRSQHLVSGRRCGVAFRPRMCSGADVVYVCVCVCVCAGCVVLEAGRC